MQIFIALKCNYNYYNKISSESMGMGTAWLWTVSLSFALMPCGRVESGYHIWAGDAGVDIKFRGESSDGELARDGGPLTCVTPVVSWLESDLQFLQNDP